MTRATLYAIAFALVILLAWATPAHASDVRRADAIVHTFNPNASIACDPALVAANEFGLTTFATGAVQFAPLVCLGLFMYDADADYRRAVQALNPTIDVETWIGIAIVLAYHEAQHSAGVRSEAVAQCLAMRYALPALASDPRATFAATVYDSRLPASYHGASC